MGSEQPHPLSTQSRAGIDELSKQDWSQKEPALVIEAFAVAIS